MAEKNLLRVFFSCTGLSYMLLLATLLMGTTVRARPAPAPAPQAAVVPHVQFSMAPLPAQMASSHNPSIIFQPGTPIFIAPVQYAVIFASSSSMTLPFDHPSGPSSPVDTTVLASSPTATEYPSPPPPINTGTTSSPTATQYPSPPSPVDTLTTPPPLVDTGTASSPTATPNPYAIPPPAPSHLVGIGIGIAVAVVAVVALIGTAILWRRRWKRRRRSDNLAPVDVEIPFRGDGIREPVYVEKASSSQLGLQRFSFEELSKATNNFSASEMLGRGGFGPVYRGVLPGDGTNKVAVKCIAENSRQGLREFEAELKTISKLHHRNLVTLMGFCNEKGSLLLVYEYMANGSLDYHLFNNERSRELSWKSRYGIATGLGSALFYLHVECKNIVIHRDVKSSNVLLDDDFNAKLGDFGLSRQVGQGITSYTTTLAGTQGYMGPELFLGGKVSSASDVYAYGGVLLELVTGKHILDASLQEYDGRLLYWVWDLYGQDKLLDAVDKRLAGMSLSDLEEARRILVVALACSHPEPKARLKIKRALDALDGTVPLPHVQTSRPIASYGPLPISYDANEPNNDNSKAHSMSTTDCTTRTDLFSSNNTVPTSSGSY